MTELIDRRFYEAMATRCEIAEAELEACGLACSEGFKRMQARIAELEKQLHRCIEHRQADEVAHQHRIEELERVLRAECIYDVGQRDPKWYCQACGNCGGATLESIEHQSDCEVARVLGL